MIRVTAPARLHFGPFGLPLEGASCWPDRHGVAAIPVRRFGGAGLMVEGPALRLSIVPAPEWWAEGPLAGRALAFARRFASTVAGGALSPQRLVVESVPPEHCGFGTGTQLGMAVARALAEVALTPDRDDAALARRTGRGSRSALGVYGFARGGFLVEGGKRDEAALSPLVARVCFPEAWRVVIAIPPGPAGLHGHRERQAFHQLAAGQVPLTTTDALCRLVLLGMLPALIEEDLDAFGEALYDFNARAGEMFAAVQGGTYASAAVAELVAFIRRQGVRGVGQSSWGPAVFAVAAGEEQAQALAGRVQAHFELAPSKVFVTRGCNRGALLQMTAVTR
jgi:beta-RFAP synthase